MMAKFSVVAVAGTPRVGDFDDVPTILAKRDDVLVSVVQFHEIEFVLTGVDDFDALELVVEFLSQLVEVRAVVGRWLDDVTVGVRRHVSRCVCPGLRCVRLRLLSVRRRLLSVRWWLLSVRWWLLSVRWWLLSVRRRLLRFGRLRRGFALGLVVLIAARRIYRRKFFGSDDVASGAPLRIVLFVFGPRANPAVRLPGRPLVRPF